ncbi:MAG TPA: isochorismatase family protein [Anaerolineae bacterium]|nr:isochorismatase family protein [Anaerolineae bacterium]
MKPALLVIDIQKSFLDINPTAKSSIEDAIWLVNAAIELFRKKDLPVVCIQHMNEAHELVPGKDGFEIPDGLAIQDSDLRIHKTYGNSFNKTPLEQELRKQGVDTVIVTGFSAEYCVLATYHGARDLDLMPIMLKGSLASGNLEHIKFVEGICEIMTFGVLSKMLE